jgi:hypothetical protein
MSSTLFIACTLAITCSRLPKVAGRKAAVRGTRHTTPDRPTLRTQVDGGVGRAGIRDRTDAQMLNLRLVFLCRARQERNESSRALP